MKNYFQYIILFLTGAVILIIEIAGARLLAPFYGSTIFVWSSLITVTMGFLALGYLGGGFLADKYPKAKCYYFIISIGSALALLLIKFSYVILNFSTYFEFRIGSLLAAFMLFAAPLTILSMAGPFVIRLNSHGNDRAGHVSGIVFGVSTLGSLVGALLVGFYLIPNFFLPNIFIFSLSVLFVCAIFGVILERSSWRMMIIAVIFFIIALIVPFTKKNDEKLIIYKKPSFYGEIQVIESGNMRCLEVNSAAQTCMNAQTGKQISPYAHMINAVIRDSFIPRGDLLVLGLGGGVLARDLQNNYQYNSMDVVEIDPEMVSVARDFFDYNDSPENIHTFIGDARTYISNTDKKYDVIILDAFSGANPVPYLYTKEAFENIKNILSPRGVLVINSLGRPYGKGELLPQSIYRTISEVFDYDHVFSTENVKDNIDDIGNIIFIASTEEKKIDIMEEYVVNYENISDKARIFSDYLNPIEILTASFVHEAQVRYWKFVNSAS